MIDIIREILDSITQERQDRCLQRQIDRAELEKAFKEVLEIIQAQQVIIDELIMQNITFYITSTNAVVRTRAELLCQKIK
jgi:hypothetical protein